MRAASPFSLLEAVLTACVHRGANQKKMEAREHRRSLSGSNASSHEAEPHHVRYSQPPHDPYWQRRDRRKQRHSDESAEQSSRAQRRTAETSLEAGARSDATSDDENLPKPKQQRKLKDRINRVLNWL